MRHAALLLGFVLAGSARADEIDDIVRATMKSEKVPGVVVHIQRGDKILKRGAYGICNLDLQVKTRQNSVFELASISKTMTAAAVMLLVEEGKVSLDDPISKYVEGTPEAWNDMTVRRLLNHTTGLRDLPWNYAKFTAPKPLRYTISAQVADVSKVPLLFKPGTSFSYTSFGYTLLGQVIAKGSGMKFADFMTKRVLQPLGMRETYFLDSEAVIPNRAEQYTKRGDGYAIWRLSTVMQAVDDKAYATFAASAADVAKFFVAVGTGKLLKPSSVSQFDTPQSLSNGTKLPNVGFGWFLRNVGNRATSGHSGYTGTMGIRFLDDGLVVVVLSNLGSGYPSPFGNDKSYDVTSFAYKIADQAAKRFGKSLAIK